MSWSSKLFRNVYKEKGEEKIKTSQIKIKNSQTTDQKIMIKGPHIKEVRVPHIKPASKREN